MGTVPKFKKKYREWENCNTLVQNHDINVLHSISLCVYGEPRCYCNHIEKLFSNHILKNEKALILKVYFLIVVQLREYRLTFHHFQWRSPNFKLEGKIIDSVLELRPSLQKIEGGKTKELRNHDQTITVVSLHSHCSKWHLIFIKVSLLKICLKWSWF